jgi:hypothetical protein
LTLALAVPGFAASNETTYRVTVVTGTVYGAGTDANVYPTMYGAERTSAERLLAGDGGGGAVALSTRVCSRALRAARVVAAAARA